VQQRFPFLPDAIFNVLNPQQDPKTGLTDLGIRVVDSAARSGNPGGYHPFDRACREPDFPDS
jgi:hypothetical protein